MGIKTLALVWLTPENYPRFVEVCDDDVPADYASWKAHVEKKLSKLDLSRFPPPEKYLVDPDEMADWCRVNYGKVDTESRAAYGAYLAMMRDSE